MRRWTAAWLGLVALTACGRHALERSAGHGDASAGAAADGGAGVGSAEGGRGAAGRVGGTAGVGADATSGLDPDAALVADARLDASADVEELRQCRSPVPLSYVTACSGCHTTRDVPNPRHPDLYGFKGSLEEFLKKVRLGGGEMAAFPASVISDADVASAFRYFTQVARPQLGPVDIGPVMPLFSPADAKNPPVFFKRDDGAIVTRGAGRVRGRHEKEGSFGQYYQNTWEVFFGFTFEDFTPLGQQRIRVTYLPSYDPTKATGSRLTNFRHWKVQGNNATFMLNDYIKDVPPPPPVPPTAPFGGVQQFDEMMAPGGRTMALGQLYEIEFGVFATGLPAGHRDSFYTDTFRYRIGVGGLTPENRDFVDLAGPLLPAQQGGDTTIAWLVAEPYMYFSQMALDTQHENVQDFLDGRRLFFTDFTTGAHLEPGNDPFPEQAGKAGPLYNARSCETCHFRNGGGSLVNGALGEQASVAIKLFAGDSLGDQLQVQEGTATLGSLRTKNVTLEDGTSVVLRAQTVTATARGANIDHLSVRVARPLVGLGLLEAVAEGTLVALADFDDCDHDGISGRLSLMKDPKTGAPRLGRFGWKAEKVSVAHQIAADASASLGVTTTLLPDEQGKVELSDADLAKLTTYVRLGGVPPQRNAADPEVVAGAKLFQTIGCAACHRTDLLTASTHPFAELRGQAVRPYTDLLLHDLGPDLADASGIAAPRNPGDPASASEWRTPPLWGIGLARTVNPDATFLHDGRAADLQEAILWHGGEAQAAMTGFTRLSANGRAALLAFLASL